MAEPAEKTKLLPPFTAIRLAWALTGSFVKDPGSSKNVAVLAEKVLKDIQDRATKVGGSELEYVETVVATVQASMRSLDTIYKGRELNFEENEKLRSVYLEDIRDKLEFGNKARDFVKSLPTMTITSGAGVITLSQLLTLPSWALWLLGLVLAGLGFLINLLIVRATRERRQKLYIQQDYERNLYYDQYVTRVGTTLTSLYLDIDRAHKNAFKQPYPIDPPDDAFHLVEEILKGVRHTMCQYVHKHIKESVVTAKLWPRCEVGDKVAQECPLWEGR
ncbi:MAG: hypothetical protein HY671_11865 [Chloroflexi bacterium]|nr:hypothetical protein [Chloroflexota bacterium]